jgi:hypothetical protein
MRVMLKGQKGMPPVGQMMSDQQIADVINYVRTHFGNAYGDGVSPADGEAAERLAPLSSSAWRPREGFSSTERTIAAVTQLQSVRAGVSS